MLPESTQYKPFWEDSHLQSASHASRDPMSLLCLPAHFEPAYSYRIATYTDFFMVRMGLVYINYMVSN